MNGITKQNASSLLIKHNEQSGKFALYLLISVNMIR